MNPFLNVAIKAARAGAAAVMKGYDRPDLLKIYPKGEHDVYTNVDTASERAILSVLKSAFPSHAILSEESPAQEVEGDYQWVVDPLDGTTNFIHHLPYFSISIALKYQGRTEHAVIYDPVHNQLFMASRGEGAQQNNRKIRLSKKATRGSSLLATELGSNEQPLINIFGDIVQALSSVFHVRQTGSAALDLALVASGTFDGFLGVRLNAVDLAAGLLIVREAGGLLSDATGTESSGESGHILAAHPKWMRGILPHLKPLLAFQSHRVAVQSEPQSP